MKHLTPLKHLLQEAEELLGQGIEVFRGLEDKAYRGEIDLPKELSSPGKHFRHLLGFFQVYLSCDSGRINYDVRVRDERIENDPTYAIEVSTGIKKTLKDFRENHQNLPGVQWLWAGHQGTPEFEGWIATSDEREIKFLIEHVIHHYALISHLLVLQNCPVPKDFGMAPSTIEYEKANQN